ncbi:MAG TPA: hypothetical protein VEI03_24360 [Stellaceae bacterium]|nr:hypothetical protein [Stellaceae bacterium]
MQSANVYVQCRLLEGSCIDGNPYRRLAFSPAQDIVANRGLTIFAAKLLIFVIGKDGAAKSGTPSTREVSGDVI